MVDFSKLQSARFWIAVATTITGCGLVWTTGDVPGNFQTIWAVVITFYFTRHRNDQQQKENTHG